MTIITAIYGIVGIAAFDCSLISVNVSFVKTVAFTGFTTTLFYDVLIRTR